MDSNTHITHTLEENSAQNSWFGSDQIIFGFKEREISAAQRRIKFNYFHPFCWLKRTEIIN